VCRGGFGKGRFAYTRLVLVIEVPSAASGMHRALFASVTSLIKPTHPFLMKHSELFDTSSPKRRMDGIRAHRSGARDRSDNR
jgi:hypothetical protein